MNALKSNNLKMGFRLPSLEGRAMKYGYSNARVRAMKGLLLKNAFLEEMIKVGTVEAMVELLQRTGYKNDLALASVKYSGSVLIETASSWNFSKTMKKLINLTPESDRAALQALLLRYDLTNLKAIMHAKKLKKSYDDIRPYLVEVSGMKEDDFKRIMKAEDSAIGRELRKTGAVRNMLSLADDPKVKDALNRAFSSVATFTKMESTIDTYVYLMMDKALSKASGKEYPNIRWILKKEIDAKNIMIIERLKKYNTPREKIKSSLIFGGTMPSLTIERMIDAKDIATVMQLARTLFPKLDMKEIKSLSESEIAFERSIASQKMLAFHRAILSAGVIIGFLLLKEEEINNLRKIAKGKEFNMSESDVRAMLVVV